MLKIRADKFAHAVEALMIAARSAKDQAGRAVYAELPRDIDRDPDGFRSAKGTSSSDVNAIRSILDEKRIRAIVLGAIIALVNGPAHVDDEHHFGAGELSALELGAAARQVGGTHY